MLNSALIPAAAPPIHPPPADYAYLGDDRDALADKLEVLKEMQGKETVARWQQWAREADLPHLFAELMALHYDPHYEKSQEMHFKAWDRRRSVATTDLSDQGIEAVADAVLAIDEPASPSA